MRTQNITAHSWNDMVFENRHNDSGVYSIRKAYSRNVGVAVVIMVTLTLLALSVPRIFQRTPLKISQPQKPTKGEMIFVENVGLKPAMIQPAN